MPIYQHMNSPNNTINRFFKNFVYCIYYIVAFCFFPFFGISQEIDPNGFNQFFYENGDVASEGFFKDGLPNGIWTSYYQNGEIKSIGKKELGLSDSIWKFFNQEGGIEYSFDYLDDKKNGCAVKFDSLGNIAEEYFYINDVIQGEKTWYYSNGRIKQTLNFTDGKKVGLLYEYSLEGTIITEEVYDNGYLKDRSEFNRLDENGKKTGVWREYFPNGIIKSEGEYKEGEKNGIYKEFDIKGS